MNKKALSLAVCIAISYPGAALALGLGEIESVSNLNQPFKAKIDLLSVGDVNVGGLKVKVASPSVFSRVGIDRPNFLNGLRFRSSTQNGRPVILVSSSQPIKEPFINFLLEVSWPKGQLLKEYTVLLDPPVLMQPGTSVASNTVGVRPDPSQRSRAQVQQQNASQQARQQQQRQRVIAQQQQTRQQQQRQRQLQQQRQQQAQNDGLRRPGPPVAPAAAATNTAGNQSRTYRIRRGDTLYKVAQKLGYNGVRNEQMMMAIFEANPTAFRKRNINNLKSGVTVRRPSINEAKRIPLRAARQDIRSQTSEWKRSKPTKSAVATNTKPSSGKVTGNNVGAGSQARIEVLGSMEGKNSANSGNLVGQAKLDDLNRQMTLASESLTARKRENNELKSRVSELEALLKKKNRLITLKNEQLAELQVSLGKPPTAMTGDGDANVVGTINEQGGDIEKMLAQNGNDGTILRSQDPANFIGNDPNQETEILQEPVGDDITTAMSAGQPAEEEGGILDMLSSPLVMGLGGGSLLALIAGFLFLRRRNNDDEYDDYSPIDFEDPSLAPGGSGFDDITTKVDPVSDADDPFAGLGGSSSSVEASGFDVDPMDEIIQEEAPDAKSSVANVPATASSHVNDDTDEDDILQEADVYIVYGLHEQAEVELKRAIEKHPENLEYRAKLLENYHASDNKEAFEVAATEFSQLNGPDKEVLWEKISGWGGKLLPASPLFASPGVAAVIKDVASKPAEMATDAIGDAKESSGLSGKLGMAAAAAAAGGVAITAGKAFAENAQDKLTDTVSGAKDSAGSAISGLTEKLPGLGDSSDNIADAVDTKSAEVLDFDDMDLDSLLSAEDNKNDDVATESTSIDAPKVDLDTGFEDADLDFAIQDMAKKDDSSSESSLGGAAAAIGGAAALGGAAMAASSTTEASDSNEMDFDFSEFEVDDGDQEDTATALESAGTNDFESLDDFDFGLDDSETETAKGELSSTNLNLALDGSDAGVGKILPENSVYKMSETKAEKDDILGEMDDDLSFLDLDNSADTGLMEAQISTKLDLARAYMDMGDVEGARSTLEEVMAEGNDDQKKEAKELLHQTG